MPSIRPGPEPLPAPTSAPVDLRLMQADDVDRVLEILAHWGMAPVAPTAACPDPEDSGLAMGRTLVAVVGQRVIGVASYLLIDAQRASTESLAVDPIWLGKGVGELLHRARLQALREHGIRRVRTTADRPSTIAWYIRRFGCRVIGTQAKRHPISLPDVADWTVLELDLDAGPTPVNHGGRA